MKLWTELCESAGLGSSPLAGAQLTGLLSAIVGLAIWLVTSVPGLGIAMGVLSIGLAIEILRLFANRRQQVLDQSWPAVFDLMRSGTQAGLSLDEQFQFLATQGPSSVRLPFTQLAADTERGLPLERSLGRFQAAVGSRNGDYVAIVLSLASELGGRGLVEIWSKAAASIRAELELLGSIRARQSWILASAKLALVAPWLVAGMLLGPAGNREVFAAPMGTLVLLLGLLISSAAYFLTNLLGRLKLPGRLFYVG